MSTSKPPGPSTLSVHGGEPRVRDGRSITAPLVLSSTYPFADTAELHAYMQGELERPEEYGRYGNPTVAAVEAKLAALEGGGAPGYAAVLRLATAKPTQADRPGHVVNSARRARAGAEVDANQTAGGF